MTREGWDDKCGARDDESGEKAGIHLGDARCYNTAGARSRQEAQIEVL